MAVFHADGNLVNSWHIELLCLFRSKKSAKFIVLDFSESGEYADIEIGDQFFKKREIFQFLFTWKIFASKTD